MYRWNQFFVAIHKTFFVLFGVFGNLNLLYIIFFTPELRNKSSYLQSVQTFAHFICLLNGILDVYLLLSDTQIPRDICFQLIFPVVFCYCVQATIMTCILLDILFNLLFPITIRNMASWVYVLAMSAGPCAFGGSVTYYGFQNLDDGLQTLCNPVPVLPQNVRKVTFNVIAVVNTLSLFLFVVLILIFRRKGHKHTYCSKLMSHLKVSAILFIASTYFSTFATSFLILIGYSSNNYYDIVANLSIFAMFSYSHTFYVIVWRSSNFRKRFLSLYSKKSNGKIVSIAPSRINRLSAPSEN